MLKFVINGVEIRVVINHIVYAVKDDSNSWTFHLTNFDPVTVSETDEGYELIERVFDTMTIQGVVSELNPLAQGVARLRAH